MVVYIEYVIIDNLIITALICSLSAKAAGVRVRRIRIFTAAVIGTAVAVVLPLIPMHFAVYILIAGVLGVTIICIMTIPKGRRVTVRYGAVFLGISFLFGGALTAVGYLVTGDIYLALTSPFVDIPLGLIVGTAVILYFVFRKVFLSVKRNRNVSSFVADAHISILGKMLRVRGLIDSGNGLYDERTGLPIILLGIKTIIEILTSAELIKIMNGQGDSICKGARYIDIETVTGKDKILILPCQKFLLYSGRKVNTMYEVMVGLKAGTLGSGVDALLHPCML